MIKLHSNTSRLLLIERLAAFYCLATLLLMAILWPRIVHPATMFTTRGLWLLMTIFVIALSSIVNDRRPDLKPWTVLARVSAQLYWLKLWYPDTYELNLCFNNLDHIFASLEQTLFGCQPALEFSRALPEAFWSEAFNLGYVSYFPMILLLTLATFIKTMLPAWQQGVKGRNIDTTQLQKVTATLICSFFIYYVIYIFVPVAGPQFYFCAVGVEQIEQGHFPALSHYFATHMDMLPKPGWADGIFHQLVAAAQEAGERPTAAFPSSHIGVATIMLFLVRRTVPRLLWLYLPLWALLCCATVYIQAHYLVDAIAGLLSAPIVYWLAKR